MLVNYRINFRLSDNNNPEATNRLVFVGPTYELDSFHVESCYGNRRSCFQVGSGWAALERSFDMHINHTLEIKDGIPNREGILYI